MDQLFTIGQLSKLFKVKVPTLRYYDEVGLLKPARVDSETHYRYYSTEQFERLNVINYLRALDLSIDSIKHFFDARDTSKLESMLLEQKEQVQKQISTLRSIEQRIDARISQVEDAMHSRLNEIELLTLPSVSVIYLNEDYRPGEDIEFPISTMRQKFGVDKSIFLGKIALIISPEKLQKHQFDDYSGLALILEPGDDKDATESLRAGMYLRLRFHGTHDTAKEQYQKLLTYCQVNDYQIIGSAVETTLIDYGITDDFDKYVTEIRIPVKEI